MRVAAEPIAMSPVPRQGQPEGWPFGVGRGQQRQRRASLQAGLSVGVAVLALTIACATNPVTGKREIALISEAQEIAMGQAADADVRREMGLYDNPELQRYVADIGHKLARLSHRPNLPWQFAVVDHPAVNAFALPGGFIYITRGILPYMKDEAELAGVLGHEIGHVTARHSVQQASRGILGQAAVIGLGVFVPATQPFGDFTSVGLGVLFMKFGRDDEREADRVGLEYIAKGGWDPGGVPRVLETLARLNELSEKGVPNWLSTHPEPAERVVDVQPIAAKFEASGGARNQDEFVQMIDGIVVGDNPKDGVVRGNVFLHPVLRFGVDFPEGWDVINTPSQVAAREPGVQHYMILQLVDQPQGRNIEEIAQRAMASAGFKQTEGQRTTLGGLEAYVGLYQGQLGDLGRVTMRAAHIVQGRSVYMLGGFAPQAEYQAIDKDVTASIGTFRELDAREAANIRPNRLDFYVVRTGDTWQSIASRGGNLVRATDLAIMNHHPVNEQPKPGERIKIVVTG